ncbi:MAG: tetraacyldisaccharide 4'-kinase [bacterium]|nr:tetraacyldisaccharide 4'-kinase [bacterium]
MAKHKVRRIERLESYLIPIIQTEGADKNVKGFWVKVLLGFLKGVSKIFGAIVWLRMWFYRIGVLRRWPLGCQVISVGNVTAGGTGKTPVVEIFARELTRQGRKVAILSRGYRRKEKPFFQRLFSDKIDPPLVVSDGRRVLLDSETGGDEPYMLATNLPGVVVLVDRNRVKSGRYAIRRFGCDTLILDDGFQYQKLKHSRDIVLVDKTNPFGNGNILPRGVLREAAKNIRRADFIFITKSNGKSEKLRKKIREYNRHAEIIECRHAPQRLKNVYGQGDQELSWLKGKRIVALSGIAVPQSFENFLRGYGAELVDCIRYADHHRYAAEEVINVVNRTADLGCDAMITTEKDAVRFPKLSTTAVPVYYLRIEIEILKGAENFCEAVRHICYKDQLDATVVTNASNENPQ